MAQKLLITGGSGFVGKALIRHLAVSHPEIEIHNVSPTPVEGVLNHSFKRGEEFDFSSLPNDFDFVVHALALSCEKYCANFDEAESVNVSFTKSVLEFCSRQASLKKFVHFSSIVLYDNTNPAPVPETAPLWPYYGNYSFTKGVAEEYVRFFSKEFDIPSVILRFSNLYGPGQKADNSPFLIPEMIGQWLHNWKIVARNATPIRDFLYVDDAVTAIDSAIFLDWVWIYNVGSWFGHSVGEVIRMIADELGVPYSFLDEEARWPLNFYSDVGKIRQTFWWNPKVSLRDGLAATISYVKDSSS